MFKKALSAFFAICLVIFAAVPAFAVSDLSVGSYEVDIKMYHAEKDKLSMGNVYLNHTGILKVEADKTTLTISTAQAVSNMRFWYYVNGSTEGDTVEVTPQENVTIAGTVYPLAFEFPVVGGSEYVGVKFSAPIMPVSPSARIKIDYSTAKPVSSQEQTTLPAQTTAAQTTVYTTEQTTAATTAAQTTSAATTVPTTAFETTTAFAATESLTAAPSTTAPAAAQAGSSATTKIKPIIIAVVLVLIVVAVVVIIVLKKKRDNDGE